MPDTAAPAGIDTTTQTTSQGRAGGAQPGAETKIDLTRPPAPKVMTLEDDPQHKMALLLGKRKAKGEVKAEEKKDGSDQGGQKDGKDAKTASGDGGAADTKTAAGIGDLIAGALKFRVEKPKEAERKDAKGDGAKAAEGGKEGEKKAEAKAGKGDDKKTIVTKKKAEPTQADHMRAAAEAAAAAASAAVTAAMPKPSGSTTRAEVPEDDLPEDYRHEFEVAKHLGTINPKYKDAAQKVLNEYARVSDYARSWESQNPGKVFDPESEDHNEFYESLEKPWSDHEFREAEIDMVAERKAAAKMEGTNAKLKEIEERHARQELAGVAQQTINSVAVLLAQNADQAAHEAIVKEGFQKFQEADPITAEALVDELNRLAPRIQTAIVVDDPQQRVSFDARKNRDQAEWLEYLYEKEAAYAGTTDDSGKLFASRAEFVKLPPAQRARRWYLTPNHLISEMVADAVNAVKARVEKERERGKKVAAALGYVPKEAKNGEAGEKTQRTEATKATEEKKAEAANNDNGKVASPAAGGGGKIDNQGATPRTPIGKVLDLTGNILFGR